MRRGRSATAVDDRPAHVRGELRVGHRRMRAERDEIIERGDARAELAFEDVEHHRHRHRARAVGDQREDAPAVDGHARRDPRVRRRECPATSEILPQRLLPMTTGAYGSTRIDDSRFGLPPITDEFSPDLDVALDAMKSVGMTGVELRTIHGTNIVDLTDSRDARSVAAARARQMAIVSIASPLLKCVFLTRRPSTNGFSRTCSGRRLRSTISRG